VGSREPAVPQAVARGFLDRARFEAARYGSDPWVFVRELLQNARDADARSVDWTAEEEDGVARVRCLDDGHGMTFAHAQAYLFRLYASSKDRSVGHAGRFGVGFWSILRYDPARIVIRSWPAAGEPWEVVLDGSLTRGERSRPPATRASGTEIVLERPAGDGGLARRVGDAAAQSARFLTCRYDPRRPLTVRVNGRPINARFDLPPPSVAFGRGALRGVVGLGPQPRVELFSKGLRVRSAVALQDLFSPSALADHTRVRFPELAEGTAPQALLEGSDLDLLLSRSDARDDRALRRLVNRAEDALARLVEKQLDRTRPRTFRRRVADAMRSGGAVVLAAAAVVSAVVVAAAWWAGGRSRTPLQEDARVPTAPAAAAQPAGVDLTRGYRDLGDAYRGPGVDGASSAGAFPLLYRPPQLDLHLATRLVATLDARGRPVSHGGDAVVPYDGPRCRADCVDIDVLVDSGPGRLRLPLPTGHRVDTETVRVAEDPVLVWASSLDEPTVIFDTAFRGLVRYRTGPAARAVTGAPAPPELPPVPAALVGKWRFLPLPRRVQAATEWARAAVAYSTDAAVGARHRAAEAEGQDFVTRSLAVGAGDCDVQNGLLLLLLQASGVPARLAIGHLGRGGMIVPGLHAWVEYGDGSGRWSVADASLPSEVLAETTARSAASGRPSAARAHPAPPATRAGSTTDTPAAAVGTSSPSITAVLALLVATAIAGATGVALALRGRRLKLRLDPGHDVVGLLRGALQHPEAFREVPAVFHRPLVPLIGGEAASLATAWTEAAEGRLYRTSARTGLARRAAAHGALVLDTSQAEGDAVASALGAQDLDAWDAALAQSRTSRLLEDVNRHLRRCGETWSARLAPDDAWPTILDWPVRRGGRRRRTTGRVVVLLDDAAPWLAEAHRRHGEQPGRAALVVLDRLLDRLDLPDARRAALLAPLARAAVAEAAR
jgi:hypothetical protein